MLSSCWVTGGSASAQAAGAADAAFSSEDGASEAGTSQSGAGRGEENGGAAPAPWSAAGAGVAAVAGRRAPSSGCAEGFKGFFRSLAASAGRCALPYFSWLGFSGELQHLAWAVTVRTGPGGRPDRSDFKKTGQQWCLGCLRLAPSTDRRQGSALTRSRSVFLNFHYMQSVGSQQPAFCYPLESCLRLTG